MGLLVFLRGLWALCCLIAAGALASFLIVAAIHLIVLAIELGWGLV